MHDNKRVFIATHSEHSHARIKRMGGGGRGPDPLKKYKNIGFLSNIGPDP